MRPNSKNVKVGSILRLKNSSDFTFKVKTLPKDDEDYFMVSHYHNGGTTECSLTPFKYSVWDNYEVIIDIEGFEI